MAIKRHSTLLILCVIGIFSCFNRASAELRTSASVTPVNVQVPLNKSLVVVLDKPFNHINLGNDSIADFNLFPPNQLLIRGRSLGTTQAILTDDNGSPTMVLDVETTHNLELLKQKLFETLPEEVIEVRSSQSCIILSGEVSSLEKMDYAIRIAQGFASSALQSSNRVAGASAIYNPQTTMPTEANASAGAGSSSTKNLGCDNVSATASNGSTNLIVNMMHIGGEQQVMLEVKIAEVSRTFARKFSIQHKGINKGANGSFDWSIISTATTAALGGATFGAAYVMGDTLMDWSLNLQRDIDLVTILAEPNLTTLSGKKASFLSGGQFPYSVCENGATIQNPCNVQFKQYGVGIEFTPVVINGNRINLKTHVVVSQLSTDAAKVTGVKSITPSLTTREADSTLELGDGQTLSIAGLISEQNTNNQQQTPGLADIPLVGGLFRNRDSSNEKKELLIMITPHLAKPMSQDQIKLPVDAFVAPDEIDFYLLGRMTGKNTTNKSKNYNAGLGGTTKRFGHQINSGN
ncbi:MAG: pilus assembly protein N-terminal domain-containing protein [Methylococcales bacterium]|nr:pilus assembly protein N-terminal domain-containing protein [Methylococcales bacterium]